MRVRLSGEVWGECEEWMKKAGEMGGSACVCGRREVFVFMCKGVFMVGVVVVDEVYC